MHKNALHHQLSGDNFLDALRRLPPLPNTIQYDDDFDEKVRSIKVVDAEEMFIVHVSGSPMKLRLVDFNDRVKPLVRNFLLLSLLRLAPQSVVLLYEGLKIWGSEEIEFLASTEPVTVQREWSRLMAKYSISTQVAGKSLLAFLCQVNFMNWTREYSVFVTKALPTSERATYASVRSGGAFLTLEEESKLIRWFDEKALAAETLDLLQVETASLLVSSYQFGMRPKQLGVIRLRDCKVRISPEDQSSVVHLTFRMLKQRDDAISKLPLIRKVKREWAPIFARLYRLKEHSDPNDFLFGFHSRNELSRALIKKLNQILGEESNRTAYSLRHSLAQRLVDSGAGHEELAAALGHSSLATGLIYFRQSVNQAEIINKALGLSEVYTTVARIAKNKFISEDELARLKGEQQIGGAPFGLGIAGIGGCQTGQPACPYNPVTSCYGCNKFMPVSDATIHRQALKEFRGVVNMFRNAGREEAHSPAFLQLQHTIASIQDVLKELEVSDE